MDEVIIQHSLYNSTDAPDNDVHSATVAKAVAMVVLFLSSFTLGSIPIKLSKWFHWEKEAKENIYVKMLLCMGGGVLLCTTFLHLLPEVQEGIEEIEELRWVKPALPELLMCIGFFTMYFVEECLHVYLHHREKGANVEILRRSLSIRRGEMEFNKEDALKDLESQNNNANKHHHHHDQHGNKGHSHVVIEEDTILSSLRGLLIVLALSIHELFEGLAVGLEDSTSNVWYMFGAVSAHKLVIAFCIGVELVTSGMKTVLVIVYVFTFAIVSPLGIGIGIGLSEKGENNTGVSSVVLQGLASGTLLYVVFFEILQSDRKSGLKNFFAVLCGFLIMCGISALATE